MQGRRGRRFMYFPCLYSRVGVLKYYDSRIILPCPKLIVRSPSEGEGVSRIINVNDVHAVGGCVSSSFGCHVSATAVSRLLTAWNRGVPPLCLL